MKKRLLLCGFIALISTAQAQVYHYIGNYDTLGVPSYLLSQGDTVTQTVLNNIYTILPERQSNLDYIDTLEYLNVKLDTATKIWISMINEGAGFTNALATYYYPKGNPPSVMSDIDTLNIVFPNASMVHSGGGLNAGDKIYLDSFAAGTEIAFCLIANGWNDSYDTVGNGFQKYFSNYNLNPETVASKRPHNVVFWDTESLKYILGFEDLKRTDGGCDDDFNDCIFYITLDPIPIFNDSTNPQPPPPIPEDDGGGLPVTWYGFEGHFQNNSNLLEWFTASELRNEYFEIQRSEDGMSFKTVGRKKGSGTTNILIRYSFTDQDISYNTGYYYRIMQVDFDGKQSYSKVLYIKSLHKNTNLIVYPNPVSGGDVIRFEVKNAGNKAEVSLYNINGQRIFNRKILESDRYQGRISTENLSSGIYFIGLYGNDFVQRIKIIVY